MKVSPGAQAREIYDTMQLAEDWQIFTTNLSKCGHFHYTVFKHLFEADAYIPSIHFINTIIIIIMIPIFILHQNFRSINTLAHAQ